MEVPESRPDILPQRKFQPGPVPPVSNGGPIKKPMEPMSQPPPTQIQPSLSPRQEPFHPLSVPQQKQIKNNQTVYQKPSSNLPRLQIPSSSSSINHNAPQNSILFGQIPLMNPFIVQPGMFKSPEQYERNRLIKIFTRLLANTSKNLVTSITLDKDFYNFKRNKSELLENN